MLIDLKINIPFIANFKNSDFQRLPANIFLSSHYP